MNKKTFGKMIISLRKEKGLTQLELAEKMCVTDKAVSKWERDLSLPDINSISKLAKILNISVDELMQIEKESKGKINKNKIEEICDVIFRAVGLAMGVAVTVLSILGELEIKSAILMLGIGLVSISIVLLKDKQNK